MDAEPSSYHVYKLATALAAPFASSFIDWKMSALQPPIRRQRCGYASVERPSGVLLWFHAVSLGECMAAIPVIRHCLLSRPHLSILLTTVSSSAWGVLQQILPPAVIVQFVPMDTPYAVERFLKHWHPQAAIFLESELWPNLILSARRHKIPMVLLNARMSDRSFKRWSLAPFRPLAAALTSAFTLVLPLSTAQAIKYQLLGARPSAIQFAGDLKLVVAEVSTTTTRETTGVARELLLSIGDRSAWIAASTHPGEEAVAVRVHLNLQGSFPSLLTIIAPRHPSRGPEIAQMVRKLGLRVSLRSQGEPLDSTIQIYIADTLGELQTLYSVVPAAFVGASMFKGMCGHNFAEAAAAGCAVITGMHVGHFARMVKDLHAANPLSVQQVDGEDELSRVVHELFADVEVLHLRRAAARSALQKVAKGIVDSVWNSLRNFVLDRNIESET